MRISDTERQRTIDELRRHCTAGRIDVDEYAERIEMVMGATTLEELDAVLHDLPMLRIADPSRLGGRGSGDGSFETRGIGAGDAAGLGTRAVAAATVLLTVVVVIVAVLLLAIVSWGWAAVLLGGWVAGLVQGSMMRRTRRT
jgi:hypothetical protein